MRKPLTGEPCAGEPHARFGGRGGLASFSAPIMLAYPWYSWIAASLTLLEMTNPGFMARMQFRSTETDNSQ